MNYFSSFHTKAYNDPCDTEDIQKKEDEGVNTYLRIANCSNIAGKPVAIDWSEQDVGVAIWKDEADTERPYTFMIPLQMFNDVFVSPKYYHLAYNGTALYRSDFITPESEYYNSPLEEKPRSEAMSKFCYNELCLNLDLNYGLKAIHGIDSFPNFNSYFIAAGLKDDLTSPDPKIFANVLRDVCEFYIGDGHSCYFSNSPYLGKEERIYGNLSPYAEWVRIRGNFNKYMDVRDSVYKTRDGDDFNLPGYELSSDGKTAIVRFDNFTLNEQAQKVAQRIEYGEKLITDDLLKEYVNYTDSTKRYHSYEEKYDTVAFIYAVNKKIQEYDAAHPTAKIENIVLDMSCNGGGYLNSAAFVTAWMLGYCDFAFTNSISGAKWTITYVADVNMNGTVGESSDTVKDKKLFCLIAPCSFSCGNMVPAMLKASDRVTILGVTSAGGACIVQPSSAADGTIFNISSRLVMSINKNGANYDADKGVDPHYYINNPENFYNVETIDALVKNINSGTLNVN